jgi:MFS family permease
MHRASGRFDLLGTLLITGALVGLIVGLGANVDVSTSTATFEELQQIPSYAGPLLLLALALFAGFVFVESRVRNPLFDLSMFRRRNLSAGALVNLFVGFCLMIGLVSVPILVNIRLEDASQLSQGALQAGVLLSALTIPMALAAVPGGWLSDRLGYQKATLMGLGLAAFGFLLIWQTWRADLSDAVIAVEMMFIGVGLGLTFSPLSAAVINSADEDHRGVASALVIILRLVGMTVAVSSLTSLALQRVAQLAAIEMGPAAVDPYQFVEVYMQITIKVLAEMGLLGAAICGVALIPAVLGLRKEKTETANPPENQPVVTPGD